MNIEIKRTQVKLGKATCVNVYAIIPVCEAFPDGLKVGIDVFPKLDEPISEERLVHAENLVRNTIYRHLGAAKLCIPVEFVDIHIQDDNLTFWDTRAAFSISAEGGAA